MLEAIVVVGQVTGIVSGNVEYTERVPSVFIIQLRYHLLFQQTNLFKERILVKLHYMYLRML